MNSLFIKNCVYLNKWKGTIQEAIKAVEQKSFLEHHFPHIWCVYNSIPVLQKCIPIVFVKVGYFGSKVLVRNQTQGLKTSSTIS